MLKISYLWLRLCLFAFMNKLGNPIELMLSFTFARHFVFVFLFEV